MLNPQKDILETRLHMWKLFFETGRDVLLPATFERYDLDAVIEAAARAGVLYDDLHLIELAELVDMMAISYLWREEDELHAALMQDDPMLEPDYVPQQAVNPMSAEERAALAAELDVILDAA